MMNGDVMALCKICGKELEKVVECAWTNCPILFWDEDRIDQIGQNGNTGEHYEEIDDEV